jgi:hypothetical protein
MANIAEHFCLRARSIGNIRDIVLFGKEDKNVLVQPNNP